MLQVTYEPLCDASRVSSFTSTSASAPALASQLSHARGEGASGKKICNFFIIINAEKFSLCDFI
jgi:hypothetical protein